MKKLWEWLNGKKRNIALIWFSVILPALASAGLMDNPKVGFTCIVIGYVFTMLGVGHDQFKKFIRDKIE